MIRIANAEDGQQLAAFAAGSRLRLHLAVGMTCSFRFCLTTAAPQFVSRNASFLTAHARRDPIGVANRVCHTATRVQIDVARWRVKANTDWPSGDVWECFGQLSIKRIAHGRVHPLLKTVNGGGRRVVTEHAGQFHPRLARRPRLSTLLAEITPSG